MAPRLTTRQNPFGTGIDERSVLHDDDAWADILATYGEQPTYQSYADPYAGAQAAYRRNLYSNLGVAGALQLGQTAVNLAPTLQDKRNKEKLAELQQLEEADDLGLTGKKRAHLERTMMDPVRAQAAQAAQQSAAQQAAMGGTRSAADANRAQREYRRDVQQSALQAGHAINQAHLQEASDQLQEIENRTKYKSEVQKRRRAATSQGITQLAGIAGKARAAQRVAELDPSALAAQGVSANELQMAMKMAGNDPDRVLSWLMLAGLR